MVIRTHSLKPVPAVILCGTMHFLGVVLGGVAVAFTLAELPSPNVLTPPDGNPAIAMLLALSLATLIWNAVARWLGIVNSVTASRARSGAGRRLVPGLGRHARLVHLPLLGFLLAGLLFRILNALIRAPALFEPTAANRPPPIWVRGLPAFIQGTEQAVPLIRQNGDDEKDLAVTDADRISQRLSGLMAMSEAE